MRVCYTTPLRPSASVSFTNEDNHKQRSRCQCLEDGFFMNVSSIRGSGVLSSGCWDKTAPFTQSGAAIHLTAKHDSV